MKSEGLYKDSEQNGIGKVYYKSGWLQQKSPYKDGKLNGVTKRYYESGFIRSETIFKNNKAISGFLYTEDGKKRKMTNAHLHKSNNIYNKQHKL